MSGKVYATKELWASYRCSFTPLYDAFRQDAYPLPLLNQLWELGANGSGASLDMANDTGMFWNSLKLIIQVTRNGHFLNSVNSLPSGLFLKGDRCMFAPLFKGTLREEGGQYPIITNYRVVDSVVEKSGQPLPVSIVISSGFTVTSKFQILNDCPPPLLKEILIGCKSLSPEFLNARQYWTYIRSVLGEGQATIGKGTS